ncbi:MAG: ketoacyl-ACP synthase III [Bacteroidetes bacterium]|nr:ketoacyl-ACP synthase III [Bacteroidota bacterium]
MAIFSINNVRIRGIAACVPVAVESNRDYDWITEEERELFIKTVGVLHRHISDSTSLASDMCAVSAQKIMEATQCDPSEIGLIIFVSQSKDYILPSSAIILQDRLGLPRTCLAFDVPLGCSGYVYGLSIAASLMNSTGIKKALLLAGDTSSLSLIRTDKSAYPLFGDAGSATLLEHTDEASPMHFSLQSDGHNHQAIIIPHGGSKNPIMPESDIAVELEKGVVRKLKNLALNGLDIFNFSVKEVPPNVSQLMAHCGYTVADIDYFIMHQANLLMNETIRKKLKFPPEKVPYSLREYGNTSSASIPITMLACLQNELSTKKNKLLLSGFGVGLSWGSVILNTEHLVLPGIIEL